MNTSENTVAQEQADALKMVRGELHKVLADIKEKMISSDQVLLQTQDTHENILQLLKEDVRQLVDEKTRLAQEIQPLREKLEGALEAMAETEKEGEKALKEKAAAEEKLEATLAEKAETEKKLEAALAEKAETEKELEAALAENSAAGKKLEVAFSEKVAAEKELEAAISEKAEVEKKFDKLHEENAGTVDELNMKIANMSVELDKALSLAEAANAQKKSLEEKVAKLQENWEKYVSGS